jgi:hypothetical protein
MQQGEAEQKCHKQHDEDGNDKGDAPNLDREQRFPPGERTMARRRFAFCESDMRMSESIAEQGDYRFLPEALE